VSKKWPQAHGHDDPAGWWSIVVGHLERELEEARSGRG
jgi:hypothetical protein